MALDNYKLSYTKDWKNPDDFPTYESREDQVREDMQLLFDEMRDAFNNFLEDLAAGIIPFSRSTEIDETDIQSAIENVQRQAASAATGDIPRRSLVGDRLEEGAVTSAELAEGAVETSNLGDLSVTAAKLGAAAVETDKIKDAAVTSDKLAGGSVVSEKLAGQAVTAGKLAASAVDTSKINDAAVTAAKLGAGAVETAKIKDAAVTAAKLASGAVETAKVKDLAVTAAKLAASAVETAKINDGAVTAAKIANGAVATWLSATIGTTWTGTSAPFTQEISISGLLASDKPIMDMLPSDTYETALAQEGAYGYVYKAVAGANTLTVYATEKTTVEIPIVLGVIRK